MTIDGILARTAALRSAALTMTLAGLVTLGLPGDLEGQVPAPRQDRPIALVGGTIHPISGPAISGGTLVFENGRITALGTNVSIPDGAERVDISGKHVYPGLVDGFSQVGLFEVGGLDVTVDVNELGPFNPNMRAELAINPESRHIGTTRSNGVLVTFPSPSGGLISGHSAAVMLDGWSYDQMTFKSRAALMVSWPNPMNANQYEAGIRELRGYFQEARAYEARVNGANGAFPEDARLEAMLPALNGEVPIVVSANEMRQIQDAITWAQEENVRIVILGGRDAGYVADQLARTQVPVLLTTVLGSPSRDWEGYDEVYGLPALLYEAGVRFGVSGGGSAPYANRLPYEAGASIAYGLPEIEALRSVTLYPAQFLGVDDRVGSLEVGKDATLLITTGNPLDYLARIEQAYIEGRKIDMADAHWQFYERYAEKGRQMLGGSNR